MITKLLSRDNNKFFILCCLVLMVTKSWWRGMSSCQVRVSMSDAIETAALLVVAMTSRVIISTIGRKLRVAVTACCYVNSFDKMRVCCVSIML